MSRDPNLQIDAKNKRTKVSRQNSESPNSPGFADEKLADKKDSAGALMAGRKDKPSIRIARELTYHALKNCISCAYLLPVINYARQRKLVDKVEIVMARTKDDYKTSTRPIIDRYFPGHEIFSPLIILKNDHGMLGMVRPEIVQECADSIMGHMNVLGDDARIDFLDGDLELKLFFQNLLLKMASNLGPEIVN